MLYSLKWDLYILNEIDFFILIILFDPVPYREFLGPVSNNIKLYLATVGLRLTALRLPETSS